MNTLEIDLKRLKNSGLTLNQYLVLLKIGKRLGVESFIIHPDDLEVLEAEEYIVKTSSSYRLTNEGLNQIEDESDLFEIFLSKFPSKAKDGIKVRRLSVNDPNSKKAKITKAIWKRITKNNLELQENIIKGLDREIEERTRQGSLWFMHNIDTWLRQADWELYLEKDDNEKVKSFEKEI